MPAFLRLFISYRRADFGGYANLIVDRIREHLASQYESNEIFLDTHSIPGGADFEAEVSAFMSIASAVIAVVGPDWCDEIIKRRGQVDHVVVELKSALSFGVPIVPLLAERVSMPASEVLTTEIKGVSRLNALRVGSGPAFASSMQLLIEQSIPLLRQRNFVLQGLELISAKTPALAFEDFILVIRGV